MSARAHVAAAVLADVRQQRHRPVHDDAPRRVRLPSYTVAPESCDGTDIRKTCIDFDYYGGSVACSSYCLYDLTGCDACAPGITCASFESEDPVAIAASGAFLGVLMASPWADLSFAELDTSLHTVSQVAVDDSSLTTVTGVPDGWLLAGGARVQHVDAAGHATPESQIWAGTAGDAAIVYGAGGRALMLWAEAAVPVRYWAALLASDGSVAVPAFTLSAGTSSSVTTDGTSFFVPTAGGLARIAPDGTVSPIVSGFPTGGPATVSWSGSTGWYVVTSGSPVAQHFTAQAFDATGAPVGMPISIASSVPVIGLQAYGTGLVGIAKHPIDAPFLGRYDVIHFDATGAQISSRELGVGIYDVAQVASTVTSAPFGVGLAVAWSGVELQVASVAP